ncbi:MAG: DUF1015 domain-containing protein [Bacteroidetes bacterium]|nr:DUF1015 domain-containing protein [Bacteroidota bacterium]
MAIVKAFKGIRPAKDKAHLVVSKSVDIYNAAYLTSKLSVNPFTFLHIIKPEFGETVKSKPGSPEQLQKIKKKFLQFIDEEILFQDTEENFYVYQQVVEGHARTGLIACASIWDYLNGKIKIHEQTFLDRVEKLKNYLEVCDFHAEPICLSYPDNKSVDEIITNILSSAPEYDFSTTNRVRHKLWKISNKKTKSEIVSAFEKIPFTYIADGHHRTASSALLGKTKKENNQHHTGEESYNFFMAVFFPQSSLKIHEYNRIVKDLNSHNKDSFLKKLTENFIIHEEGEISYTPDKKGNFSMYLEGKWYSLVVKKSSSDKLDVDLLSELVLSPILDIHNPQAEKRILYVNGYKGINELKKIVDTGKAAVGFGLYPITVSDIVKVADRNGTMPPKSTWVEPKTRSGLVIYSLTSPLSSPKGEGANSQ